jgi:hypothetical protein
VISMCSHGLQKIDPQDASRTQSPPQRSQYFSSTRFPDL